MNQATAKRWIESMPLPDGVKTDALKNIKDKNNKELGDYMASLKQKCGSKFYMNKQAKPFWTK